MKITYSEDLLFQALGDLARPEGIRERVTRAWVSKLYKVREKDLPEEDDIRADFGRLRSQVTAVSGAGDETGYKANIAEMSEEQLAEHAHVLYLIVYALARRRG